MLLGIYKSRSKYHLVRPSINVFDDKLSRIKRFIKVIETNDINIDVIFNSPSLGNFYAPKISSVAINTVELTVQTIFAPFKTKCDIDLFSYSLIDSEGFEVVERRVHEAGCLVFKKNTKVRLTLETKLEA